MAIEQRTPEVRVDELRTKREIARVYFGQGSPQVIAAVAVAAFVVRVIVGEWGWADVVVVGVTALLVGPVEWVIHRYLLHAEPDSWQMAKLGTGHGHREHHLDPPALEWLLLRAADARLYAVGIALFTAAWALPVAWATSVVVAGQPIVPPALTALVLAYLSLGHYEWTHLLVHTRYRPRTRYYQRLARNHRLHHFRNEGFWLGVTSNLGDRMLGTYPAHKSDVPLSDTARTLT